MSTLCGFHGLLDDDDDDDVGARAPLVRPSVTYQGHSYVHDPKKCWVCQWGKGKGGEIGGRAGRGASVAALAGRRALSGRAVAKGKSPHKAAVLGAISAGKKAVAAGQQGEKIARSYDPKKHVPLVKVAARVNPRTGRVAIGAVTPPGKMPLTPKQDAAVRKHAAAIARNASANRALGIAASKSTRAGKKALSFANTASAFLKKKLTGEGSKSRAGAAAAARGAAARKVAGRGRAIGFLEECLDIDVESLGYEELVEMYDLLEEAEEMGLAGDRMEIGEGEESEVVPAEATVPGDAVVTDPLMMPGQVDEETGIVTDGAGNVVYDPAQDPEVIALPERGQKMSPKDTKQVWRKMPEDGFVFQEGRYPQTVNGVGSWNVFHGSDKNEHGWGYGWLYTDQRRFQYQAPENKKYAEPGGSEAAAAAAATVFGLPFFIPAAAAIAKKDVPDRGFRDATGHDTVALMAKNSIERGWGPLIGNPNDPNLAGLQYAMDEDKWFWQGKYAPAEVTAEADAKIAEANRQTIEANTMAALAEVARKAKEAAERQEAIERQAAEDALRESRAESERMVEESKQETLKQQQEIERADREAREASAQAAADREAAARDKEVEAERQRAEAAERAELTRLDAEIARAEIPVAAREAELELEAQAAEQNRLIQEAARYDAWAAANPGEAARLAAEQRGGGDDWGGYDDGEGWDEV